MSASAVPFDVDHLTAEQKRAVVQRLLPDVLESVRDPRSVRGPDGRVIGYFIPAQTPDTADLLPPPTVADEVSVRPAPGPSAGSWTGRWQREKDLFAPDLGGGD